MRAGRTPQAVMIAGPNGAGKTSSAPDLLQEAVGIDAFESTLAGRSAHRLLTGLVGVGYDVHIFYFCAREPVVLNEATWLEIRKRIEEVA